MRTALCMLLLLLCGCSSPPVLFHALPIPQPVEGDSTLAVVVGPIRLPAHLNRPYITWRTGQTRLVFDEYNRWGAPLDVELLRATTDQLATRLGTRRVVAWPAQDPSGTALRVSLDVEQLDLMADGAARMRARYIIRRGKEGAALSDGVAVVEARMNGGNADAALGAYAALVDGLAAQLTEAVRDAPR